MKNYIKKPCLVIVLLAAFGLLFADQATAETPKTAINVPIVPTSTLTITDQPTNQIVECGTTATLTVSASDSLPMNYQWTFSGTNITDATDTSLTLSPASIAESGSYTVIITDGTDTATSQVALITVQDTNPPVITVIGSAATNIECSTIFTDPGASENDACAGSGLCVTTSGSVNAGTMGTYVLSYVATDPSGNSATNTRIVVVDDTNAPMMSLYGPDPACVLQFASFIDPGATANDDCAGSLTVTTIGSVNAGTLGTYSLTYSASGASALVTNMTREVIVTKAPEIRFTTQPASVAVNLGGEAAFTSLAVVTNSEPIKYQWYIKTGSVTKKGKTTASFNIASVKTTDAGSYYVIASMTIPKTSTTPAKTYTATSSVVTLSINTSVLTVNIVGNGSTVPVGSALFGAANNNAVLYVGHNYSIKAVPGTVEVPAAKIVVTPTSDVFDNWEVATLTETNWMPEVGNALGKDLELTFTMESNLVLTATFEENPFVANSLVGSYNGLFFEGDELPECQQSTGFINNLTVKANGTYSGKILMGADSYSISGTFDLDGNDLEIVNRSSHGLSNLVVFMNLTCETNTSNTGYIEGEVANLEEGNNWEASLNMDQNTESPYAAPQYTLLIPPGESYASPTGFGFASITNNNIAKGNLAIAGKLADGTAFSQSVAMDYYTDVPIYVPLNKNQGLLAGWIYLDGPGVIGGGLSWFKPGGLITPITYTNGFTNYVRVIGAPYQAEAGEPAVDIFDGMASVTGICDLGTPFCFPIAVNDNDMIVALPGAVTNAFSGLITFKNGLFTAKFRPTDLGAKSDVTCYGAVLQLSGPESYSSKAVNNSYFGGLSGAGFFLSTTNTVTGSILLEGGESITIYEGKQK